jgi:RDD family
MAVPQRAVYYRTEDYLGVMRRLLIDFVDTGVAAGVSVALTVLVVVLSPADELTVLLAMIAWAAVWIAYFVVLKGSRFRTLGYLLAGARIVNFSGVRPRRLALLGRLAFTVLGPANFLIDLLWVSSDPSRQALRDKVAHTFVVRNDALPIGTGRIAYPTYMVFGWTLMFAEVQPAP